MIKISLGTIVVVIGAQSVLVIAKARD